MRRLILMRHAESHPRRGQGSDHERPLSQRGLLQAPRVARRLAELGWAPDAVLSSDSTRTRQTWAAMAKELPDAPAPIFSRALYCAAWDAVREASPHVAPAHATLLVLGHNPGWAVAVHHLGGRPEAMPPASAALLEGEGDDWPAALQAEWRLVDVLRP